MARFEFGDYVFEHEDVLEVTNHAVNWADENWDVFVEWTDYLVTKENYEQYIEDFLEETITE